LFRIKIINLMSQFQSVSPPHYGGIFDSSVMGKLSDSEIPDFERKRIGNFNRRMMPYRSLRLPLRIEISDQAEISADFEWSVLKLALRQA